VSVCGPTFLIVGAARSGTTMLGRTLARHPAVHLTDPKEPHFLAFADRPPSFQGPGDDEYVNRVAITSESAWRSLFRPGLNHLARGEGSVTSLYYSAEAAPNIQRFCPDAKLIAVLREPVSRAFSAWGYLVRLGFETEEFETALDLEDERVAANWQHMWHYTRAGDYSRQLDPFLSSFAPDQLLVLDYDTIRHDPATALRTCFEFLGVPPQPLLDFGREVNSSGAPRNTALAKAMNRLRRHQALRRLVRRSLPYGMRERLRRANLRPLEFPPGAGPRLEARYAGEKLKIKEMLGEAAPQWARL
jgi:hypothetical protein